MTTNKEDRTKTLRVADLVNPPDSLSYSDQTKQHAELYFYEPQLPDSLQNTIFIIWPILAVWEVYDGLRLVSILRMAKRHPKVNSYSFRSFPIPLLCPH
jgi:hypothetical protein